MASGKSLEGKTKRRNPTLADIARTRHKLLKERSGRKETLPIHEYLEMEMLHTLQIHNEYLQKILRRFDGQPET